MDSALLVVTMDKTAAAACEQIGLQQRCHAGQHMGDAALVHLDAGRHGASFAKARYILNALSLGYGVLYLDPHVQLLANPLPALLGAAMQDHDIVSADATRGGSGCGLLLLRPTAAASRCAYDWVLAVWSASGTSDGDGSSGGSNDSGDGSGDGSGNGSGGGSSSGRGGEPTGPGDLGDEGGGGAPVADEEAAHGFGRVVPPCVRLFGGGVGAAPAAGLLQCTSL
ncbi:hypothetical protein FOA52_006338 [Chlamydomonas sp. UWO 241]|nr:hypothetical protein FOA52_006338 [Chlamydomonas sp. UWO 241]